MRDQSIGASVFDHLDKELKTIAGQKKGLRYVSLVDALGFDRDTLITGNCLTFHDEDHFSDCGEALFGAAIDGALRAAS